MREEGWYHDPYEVHEDRWFSDGRPTRLVKDEGVESYDDPPPGEPPEPVIPVAEEPVSDGEDLLRADEAEQHWVNPVDGSGASGIGST